MMSKRPWPGAVLAGALASWSWLCPARAQVEVQRLGTEQGQSAPSSSTRIGEKAEIPAVAAGAAPALFGEEPQSAAEAPAEPVVPETHVVKKGDTLWDISQTYFQDPWRWPQLWARNPLITNPHWIFPGDVVRLREPGEAGQAPPAAKPITPGITRSGEKSFTTNGIGLRELGFVDPQELKWDGEINGSREEKIMLATGDSAYVAFSAEKPLRAGERYSIYLPDADNPVRDPRTGAVLGYMVHIIGDIQIEQVTEGHVARGTLVDLVESVERTYRVGQVFRQFKTIEPKASAVSIESTIAGRISPDTFIAFGMLVVMDRGRSSGVEVGNRFFVIRRGDGYRGVLEGWTADDPAFPKEVVGELLVVDVRDTVSVAYVLRGSKELRVGDLGEMRRGY